MGKGAVRVVVRTRPTANFAHGVLTVKPENASVDVFIKRKESQGLVNNQRTNYSFRFDNVLHNVSQDNVYDDCGRDIVANVMNGYNGTIMAYGQTGAGKTYTMTGGLADYKVRGMVPRAIQQVFSEISARPEQAVTVRISYLEIYNETLFDLLTPGNSANGDDIQILDDAKGAISTRGLTKAVAATEEDALNLLFEGEANRAIGEHQLNKASSRSHCIFTLHIEQRSRVESSERVLQSKLHLVDLAGSERVSKTGSSGVVLKEAMYINRSLSFLEQVVNALTDRGRDHVPFRQSKLTHYMRDSLGGNCKTLMVANIWGEESHIDETISTLQFATRMMKVRTEAVVNVQLDPALLVKKYEREIKELKQELAMHDALAGRAKVQYEEYDEEQRYQLQQQIRQYVDGEIEELPVQNLRHVREFFGQFKALCQQVMADGGGRAGLKSAGSMRPGTAGISGTEPPAETEEEEQGVGTVEGGGFGVGVASDDARPSKPVGAGMGGRDSSIGDAPSPAPSPARKVRVEGGAVPDKADAFAEFKENEGKELNDMLKGNIASLKDKKKAIKDAAIQVNQCKSDIDVMKGQLEEMRAKNGNSKAESGQQIVDEEEFAIIKKLKEAKSSYRENFEQMRMLKSEAEYTQRLVDSSRTKMVAEFDAWFAALYEGGDGVARDVNSGPSKAVSIAQAADMENDGEVMDDAEKFERMEVDKVMSEDPESLAFHKARKARMMGKTQSNLGASRAKRH